MLVSREKIQKDVQLVLQHYNSKRKMKDKIISQFENQGFLYGEINAIFSGTNPLIQVSDELFYLLIVILHKTIDDEILKDKINPDKVLTQIEKDIAVNLTIDRKKDGIYPIVIENVTMDADDDYSTTFTLGKLVNDYFDKRIIKYNSETQRPLVSKYYLGEERKEIYINQKNRVAIAKNIANDNQIPDEIVFNILQTGDEEFEYNPNTRKLTIYAGDFCCIDGWHRTVAGRDAYRKKPSANFYYKVRIVHWDVNKAKAFVRQKSLGTQINLLEHKIYDVFNPVHHVVKKLNDDATSPIRGKVTNEESDIKCGGALVTFNVLFDSISGLMDINDNKDVFKVSNYLKEGLSLIADFNADFLENPILDQIWVTYMAILSKYRDEEDWQTKLMETIDKLDDNTIQSIPYRTINKTFINKIKEYVDSIN